MSNMPDTVQLLERIRTGDRQAVELLMARHRDLLKQYVESRLDAGLRSRIDPSDIVQEAQLEMARRMEDYLAREPMPFHVWVRKTAYQNLVRLRRKHLNAQRRMRIREIPLPESISLLLVGRIVQQGSEVLDELVRKELAQRVQVAMAQLPETDREILLLRAYEGLDNQNVALMLELDPGTCSKRYTRALLKLRRELLNGKSDQSEL